MFLIKILLVTAVIIIIFRLGTKLELALFGFLDRVILNTLTREKHIALWSVEHIANETKLPKKEVIQSLERLEVQNKVMSIMVGHTKLYRLRKS